MTISIKELLGHLDNMVKQGKGDLPVYLVQRDSESALPLEKGDTLNYGGKKMLLLVPEAPYNIKP